MEVVGDVRRVMQNTAENGSFWLFTFAFLAPVSEL